MASDLHVVKHLFIEIYVLPGEGVFAKIRALQF
jgi:hypothetical protein